MEEKDKYYTPKISEFHAGFPYQKLSKFGRGTWYNRVFVLETNLKDTFKAVNDGIIRVKLIDKEDIESLGFKAYKGMEDHPKYHQSFKNGNYAIKYNMVTNKIRIICLHLGLFTESEDCRFSGILKNKSELINQLKRCQIEIKNESSRNRRSKCGR